MRKPKLSRGFFWRGGIVWTRWEGKPVSTKCKDPTAAYAERAQWERRRADPTYAAATTTSIAVAAKGYIDALRANGRSDNTISAYTTRAGHFVRVFGSTCPLSRVQPPVVEDYATQRSGEGAKPLTVSAEIVFLQGLMRWSNHRGTSKVDVESLRPPLLEAVYVPRRRYLETAEVPRLLTELDTHRQAWVMAAIACGGRLEEVNRIRVSDVDMDAGTMIIRKTKTTRKTGIGVYTIPIPAFARPLLEYALRHGKGRDGLMLRNWSRSNSNLTLRRACVRAKLPQVSANDLRRTHATWLIQAGAAPNLVAFMLGHTSSTMVERVYGRQNAEAVGKLLAKCDGSVSRVVFEGLETVGNVNQKTQETPGKTPIPDQADGSSKYASKRAGGPKKQAQKQITDPPTVTDLYREPASPRGGVLASLAEAVRLAAMSGDAGAVAAATTALQAVMGSAPPMPAGVVDMASARTRSRR